MIDPACRQTIQYNCDISDARHNGIYSICTLVLKLRNLYKWENNLDPWQEPAAAEILDWIAAKEAYWEGLINQPFLPLPINNDQAVDPFHEETVNQTLAGTNLVYGAGYGRSLKAIFFLAEQLAERQVEGCRTIILGREQARELAGPLAMLQESTIYIRKQPLRFYFWDQILEMRSSGKAALLHSLALYGLNIDSGRVDRNHLAQTLDRIVEQELDGFIYHEVGEAQENPLAGETLKKIITVFPDSTIEFFARAVKDILADTHPKGMLGYIIAAEKEASLGFYIAFLDGLRRLLFPEIVEAGQRFLAGGDWQAIEQARLACRQENTVRAEKLQAIFAGYPQYPVARLKAEIERQLLVPLGIGPPVAGDST